MQSFPAWTLRCSALHRKSARFQPQSGRVLLPVSLQTRYTPDNHRVPDKPVLSDIYSGFSQHKKFTAPDSGFPRLICAPPSASETKYRAVSLLIFPECILLRLSVLVRCVSSALRLLSVRLSALWSLPLLICISKLQLSELLLYQVLPFS